MGAYTPPGLTVQELTSTAVSAQISGPETLCLVGPASGAITRTDPIVLTGVTPSQLPGLPRDQNGALLATLTGTGDGVSLVMDAVDPSLAPNGFSSSTDYSVNTTTGSIQRTTTARTLNGTAASGQPSFTLVSGAVPAANDVVYLTNTGTNPVSEAVTVLSVSGQVVTATTNLVNSYATAAAAAWSESLIPSGDTVYVTYSYTPNDYFTAIRLDNMQDIQTRFGDAFDPTGTFINSPLSYAASLAFQNGAVNLVLQPLYFLNNGVPQAPTANQIKTAATWQSVFNNLQFDGLGVLVPVAGQNLPGITGLTDAIQYQIMSYTQDYVFRQATPVYGEPQYIVAILGEDSSGSTSVAQDATLHAHAQQLVSKYGGRAGQQCVLINTSEFAVPNSQGTFLVGAQYIAAAVGGMLIARSPAGTLTREAISGVISVTDFRTPAQKLADGQNSLFVIENKSGFVQVRHGITLDSSSVLTRELNVVRAKHFTIDSIAQTLDSQVIGKLVADSNAPTLVNNLVIGTLEDLLGQDILQSYGNVASQITSFDPTIMAVQFSYQPTFVVNVINVTFSLDLTNNIVTVDTNAA